MPDQHAGVQLSLPDFCRSELCTVLHGHAVCNGGSGASTGCAPNPTDSHPTNRFSCNGTLPLGPERSVVKRTASSERKLMLMDAMSEFDASNRNCRIGKRLEAFH